MASAEELFISISPQSYRQGKSAILTGETELLTSLKHLQNLKVLARQKNDLKKILHRLISSLHTEIDSIKNKMPTPQIPKAVSKHEESRIEVEKIFHGHDKIDEELMLIQEKLKKLNS